MTMIDSTITGVLPPSMQHDLGLSQRGIAWVVSAYLFAVAVLLRLGGRRRGARR
jgi:MFS family permease